MLTTGKVLSTRMARQEPADRWHTTIPFSGQRTVSQGKTTLERLPYVIYTNINERRDPDHEMSTCWSSKMELSSVGQEHDNQYGGQDYKDNCKC